MKHKYITIYIVFPKQTLLNQYFSKEMAQVIEYIQNPNGIEAKEEERRKSGIKSSNMYTVEIRPGGKWIDMNPNYIIFKDHVTEGYHNCDSCRCSFCNEPSIANITKLKNGSTGEVAGHRYCLSCLKRDYSHAMKQ